MIARLRGRSGSDGGFTLTELLVVVTLFAIIGGVVSIATITGLKNQSKVQDRNDAMAQVRTALQRVGRDIRSAADVEYASDTQLVLLENQTSSSWTVTYSIVPDGSKYDLTATRSDQGTTITLLQNLVNVTTSPVFSYIESPTSTSTVTTYNCAIGTSPQTYAQDCIGTITLSFSIQPETLSQPITMSDNGTELRNAS